MPLFLYFHLSLTLTFFFSGGVTSCTIGGVITGLNGFGFLSPDIKGIGMGVERALQKSKVLGREVSPALASVLSFLLLLFYFIIFLFVERGENLETRSELPHQVLFHYLYLQGTIWSCALLEVWGVTSGKPSSSSFNPPNMYVNLRPSVRTYITG